ncbi:hypothetical protein BC936DRAFT_140837 [Jimgerdemannia flammicorona]|uniref:Uncharacterized protein n=1 Tax=Jimgerdemannia flammicorona TaxID=994334 RepID=A0A433A3H8_9FUNG|nr:hypothetical protein BC936DRAFT_140837 [Jimgerdemannia flammicorona]
MNHSATSSKHGKPSSTILLPPAHKIILSSSTPSPFSYNAPHVRTTLLCPGGISTALFRGVYYPIPFVTPVLEPTAVADEILRALDEDCGRTVYKPFYVNLMPLMRALPVEARDLIMAVSGCWVGRVSHVSYFEYD